MDENNITSTENKATEPVNLTVPRQVTILRREGNSAYFRRNAKFIPEGKIKIGSSIKSVDRLRANRAELDKYMPLLLGVGSNDPKYGEMLNAWFYNISTPVPETGLRLNIGFIYNDENGLKTVQEIEKKIYTKFNESKKGNPTDRDLAIEVRDKEIIELESSKYKYGSPINPAEYMLWRYCLVYGDVANDVALINKSGGIRFYIYDAVQERYKEEIEFNIRKQASIIYVKLLNESSKVNEILWNYMGQSTDVSSLSEIDKFKALETLSKANPTNLISLYKDTNLGIKAQIEQMIHYGILRRLDGTNVIVDENNDIIGNDMSQVIVFFKNTERNKPQITTFTSKLKNYTNG